MVQRTGLTEVQGLLGDSSLAANNGRGDWDGVTSLQVFIDSATRIVDRVVTCATNRGYTLDAGELELIERWLSAHLYTKNDPIFQSKSTKGASATYVQGEDPPERYKAGALVMDPSGCLKALLAGNRARAAWLGRRPSAQTDYENRS